MVRIRDEERVVDLGDVIADAAVHKLYHRLIAYVSGLHEDLDMRRSAVEIHAEYHGRPLCRIVPYRELLHIHVGDAPAWEVRVRDDAGFLEAVHRILENFAAMAALDGRTPAN